MAKRGRSIPDHKKHSAFPGLIASPDVRIEAQTIKPITPKRPENIGVGKPAVLGPEWERYEAALVKIRDTNANHAVDSLLPLRNQFEQDYAVASRKLRKEGKLYSIKKKYR